MPEIISKNLILVLVLSAIWTIPWKGFALWKSARCGDRGWFVVILLINTLAFLEILYIFIFSKKKGIKFSTDANKN
jgi:hypothetical protein